MAVAGSLTYDTKIDKSGFKKGLNGLEKETSSTGTKIKDIVAGLGVTKIIGKAFSLINDNMDSAIKRIDTLNNFPKVMSNLGISSEDSTKAINKLSDGLKGIPTKLDDASLAVQRFTSINNDVNKSTDYFLAFNNALLAGGASADIQSNALEQLSQMYAVGTVDAQAWRSVQTAMPAQLQQVAQSMGYTSTAVGGDFYNAIQKGKISMEDFMQQIVKLNKEGTGQYASFAEQAKSATGGIQTAISNAKTAISRGVAELISKVNEGLQNAGIGSISDIISEKGKNIEKVLKAVAEQIPKIIEWVVKNKDSLISLAEVIATVVGAYKLYELTLLAIKGIQFVSSISGTILAFAKLIPCIKSVKDAMILLNMVISVNPIALLVTAIGLLVAGFIYLWNTSEGFRNFWIGLWEKIKQGTSVAVENITNFFTEILPNSIENMIEWFKNLPQKMYEVFWDFFQPIEDAFWDIYEKVTAVIEETAERVTDYIKTTWQKIVEFFTNTIPNWFEELKRNVLEKIKELWSSIVNFWTQTVPQWLENAKKWLQKLPYRIGYALGQALGNIVKFGVGVWNWVTVELPAIIQAILDWFIQLPGRIWECLKQTITDIKNWGQQIWKETKTSVSNTINEVSKWFSQLPGRIWEWLLQTISNIQNWGQQVWDNVKTTMSNMIDIAVEWISQLPRKNMGMVSANSY